MREPFKCLVGSTLLVAAAHAHATFEGGNDLYALMKAPGPGSNQEIFARGYVAGVVDSLIDRGELCMPDSVKATDVSVVVKKWLDEHPDKRDYTAASIIEGATMELWRCKK
jgi:hypothetical protein